MPPHIVVIGAGQLGSRHLQALANIEFPIIISVIDPSQDSIFTAQQRFEQMGHKGNIHKISFLQEIPNLDKPIDVAIIATHADIRKSVTMELLQHSAPRYLVLEKVAFQSIRDFEECIEVLKRADVKVYVNCPRRMYPFYKKIKSYFIPKEPLYYRFEGGGSALGSNCIHLIDLYAFFSEDYEIQLNGAGLDPVNLNGDRSPFLDFTGTIVGNAKSGGSISIVSYSQSNAPGVTQLLGPQSRFIIFETEGRVLESHQKKDWKWEETLPGQIQVFQSQLTHLVIQQLLQSGTCELTPLAQSFQIHRPILELFLNHLNALSKRNYTQCPIS